MASLITRNLRSGAARQTLTGLDVEPGFVSAARVSVNGRVVVEQAAGVPLAGDVLREGEVNDVPALAEALRELFKGGFDKRVRIGLASQRVVLRTLELPPIDDRKEMAAAVRFQAEDQVPMPLASAVLDFHPLGISETPNGPRLRVAVVAAQRELVERLLSAARLAGLRPESVDLSAFALIRALQPLQPRDDDAAVVYLSVGGLTNMAVANGTICVFTRVLGGGLEAIATQVAERRGIQLAAARELCMGIGVDPERPTRAARPTTMDEITGGGDAHPATPDAPAADAAEAEVRSVIAAGVREIATEVRNSLDFHVAQGAEALPSRVVLSGAAAEVPGFPERLAAELDMPVSTSLVAAPKAGTLSGVSPSRLSVAAGLAIEEAPR
ncbi:MAG TPA: type II secretion system protein GspL [Solirubrobacteraceae bacterium]|jgi:type IV pilus assembly protein PilM|nr:type II secretion system protein GspL [Solirubrobacteraceae bacterium]